MLHNDGDARISVIVPIYNTEQYLPVCIDSILAQTYQNLEIILVDDGSTDQSASICDAYQKKDRRIQVIHKKNGGNTSARKAGMERASGDYVGFVDSDDWIDEEMYEALIRAIQTEDAELVMSGLFYEYGDTVKTGFDGVKPGVYRDARLDTLRNSMIPVPGQEKSGIISALYTKLFKRDLFYPILMGMGDEVQFGEDTVSVYAYLLSANCVVVLGQAFYHYRQRSDSLIHIQDSSYLTKINAMYTFFHKSAERGGYSAELATRFDQYIFELCLQTPERLLGCTKRIPTYAFPFAMIPMNSRLILYGAGIVGRSYYNLINWTNSFQIVGWIDRDHQRLQLENVCGMEVLRETDYDYVVIAVQNESAATQIRETLREQGVLEEKILWFKPTHLFEILFQ